jgi:hypothetical protein
VKWHRIALFNGSGNGPQPGGGALPEGDFTAVAIASDSDVDTCLVGDRILSPGALLDCRNRQLTPVRGYRTYVMPGGVETTQIGSTLSLMLFEKCDPLFTPPPRSTTVVSARVDCSAAISGAAPLLRLPFSGRKQASFAIRRTDSEADVVGTAKVRGIRYHSHAQQDALRAAGIDPDTEAPVIVDDIDYAYTGVFSATNEAIVGLVIHVGGGGDLQEAFDELELFFFGAVGLVYVQGEANGERGQ